MKLQEVFKVKECDPHRVHAILPEQTDEERRGNADMSKLTVFGQLTRTLRLEHDDFLRDMAEHLGVSPAYLSAVERGQRNAPHYWVKRLQMAYNLSENTTAALEKALDESRAYSKIDVSHLSHDDRRLVRALVAQFPTFGDGERATIQQLIDLSYRT